MCFCTSWDLMLSFCMFVSFFSSAGVLLSSSLYVCLLFCTFVNSGSLG